MPIESPPAIPSWIQKEYPFNRALHREGDELLHYVDEGEGPAVLMVHGNPMWSFLWRKVIPLVTQAGFRVLAPDLLGFGFSSKLKRPEDHQLQRHIDRLCSWLDEIDVHDLTLVGQDWGGPISAGVGLNRPERCGAAVFANTAVLRPKRPFRPGKFHRFSHVPLLSDIAFKGLLFPVPVLSAVQGNRRSISPRALAAYAYPFRGTNRSSSLGLTRMVPTHEDHASTRVMESIGIWAENFTGPVGLVWGQRDPILGRAFKRHRELFSQAPFVLTEAGHFLQEEVPAVLAEMIVKTATQLQSRKKSSISSSDGSTAY